MGKIIRLTESDLARIVRQVISEHKNINKSKFGFGESDLTRLGRRVVLTEQALNGTMLNEGWKDVFLGIALLTGVGMNQSQAQVAKKALSNDDVKRKIESALQDTATLNQITKNLSPKIKEKITKNANKALEDLESKHGRVTSTVRANDDTQLTSRLKQGYALTDVETKILDNLELIGMKEGSARSRKKIN